MSKIVYLFGAGASAQALPLGKKLPLEIGKFAAELKKPKYSLSETDKYRFGHEESGYTKAQFQKKLIDSLKHLEKEGKAHNNSIDTYFKKLYVKGDIRNRILEYKTALTLYFIYAQHTYHVDSRYDIFFASITEKGPKLNNLIRILSWNYDYQFEKAYADYIDDNRLEIIRSKLYVV